MFDVATRTVFVTLAGSQAHGTAREGSDVDLRGVCVAPFEWRVSLYRSFEQDESPLAGPLWELVRARLELHPVAGRAFGTRTESVVFEVGKFLTLCATGNPNALEILFADERDWLFETALWQRLHAERRQFLTRKVQQTYLGYGLPDGGTLGHDDLNRLEQSLAEKVRSYGIDTLEMPKPLRIALEARLLDFWRDTLGCSEEELEKRTRAVASRALDVPASVIATLNAEKKYLAAMKHWESYQTWKTERNPGRAELERRHGYDTKHAMHLVRLMRMGLEVLRDGELRVKRPDAAELNAIRDGALSYDELMAAAAALEAQMEAAAETTALPKDVDRQGVDQLFREIVREFP
jgi:hypothetical protein